MAKWMRIGMFVYELTVDDEGDPVNFWEANVQGGGPFSASEEQLEDVARLIAAAPQMLEALTDIVEYQGGAENALEDEYVMDRVHAAIAAAEEAADDLSP